MQPQRNRRRFLTQLLVILLTLAGSASTLAAPAAPHWTASPLSPSNQSTLALIKPNAAQSPSSARAAGAVQPTSKMISVIVKLDVDSLASYRGGVPGLPATSPRVTGAEQVDAQSPASQKYLAYVNAKQDSFTASAQQIIPTATMTQKYDVIVGGVAMQLPEDQLATLSKLPGVLAIYPDELLHLDTDRSPAFIGAPTIWSALGGQESAGDNVIVGILDSGIWPEHPSLADPDPSGKPYTTPPPAPSGQPRLCQFSGGAHPGPAFTCNNKLIGAYRFMSTYESVVGLLPGEFTTARDDDGHGTHTATTTAGDAGVKATIFGIPRGTISGIAPRARVIAYKICGDEGCFQSDSAAAVQQAIRDGVNVINFSISGGANPFADVVEQAFLDAYDAGVFVAASAGNSGPTPETTDHRGPWVTTVAASTSDRAFKNTITVTGNGRASLKLEGVSVTKGVGPAPLVVPINDPLCLGPVAPGTYTGKIVICQRGPNRVLKGVTVLGAGAVGMILYNPAANVTDQLSDNHFLPASHIQFDQGTALLAFLTANPGAKATLSSSFKGTQQGDVMASFSSRGGPGQSLGISKPDITAPGVQILAGHTPASVSIATGPVGELFQAIAGTSMSSPHIAGSGALLKALHPNWTPGQIKSALMTTARTNVVKEDGKTRANAFDYGSGRVDLTNAGDPGLTFDVSASDYITHAADLWSVNYPSVYFPVMPGQATVKRTAHSVLTKKSEWDLEVRAPNDVKISVPHRLVVPAGGDTTFSITVDARDVPIGAVRFATLTLRQNGGWGNDQRVLHMPITFVRNQPVVTLAKTCDPASIARNAITTCTITAQNSALGDANVRISDQLPEELKLIPGSVTGGTSRGNTVSFNGTLVGALPPDVAIAATTIDDVPATYVPLSEFDIEPFGAGDDTITNFNVPAFTYAGQTYTSLGVSSNGIVVVGGSSGVGDATPANQSLPNETRPNNVIAGFWTDLNPTVAGGVSIGVLTDGIDDWIVVEWGGVPEFSTDANVHSFEIWIGVSEDTTPEQDITVVYGDNIGDGDLHTATVGAENLFGNRGGNIYFNGTGTLPALDTLLRVTGAAPVPGEAHVITFQARGRERGTYTNYAEMTGSNFFGTNIARFVGTVRR